jgi:hypothetical protein
VPVDDPEEQLQHDTEGLDERIDRVEAHIGESRDKLKARQEDAHEIGDEDADALGDEEADDAQDGDPAGFDDPEEVDDLDVKEEE